VLTGARRCCPFTSQRITSPQAMTLDAIANIPRSAFSRQQIQMMFWFLKRVIRPSAYLPRTEWHNLAPSSPTLDRQPSMEPEPLMVRDPGVRHEDYPAGWLRLSPGVRTSPLPRVQFSRCSPSSSARASLACLVVPADKLKRAWKRRCLVS